MAQDSGALALGAAATESAAEHMVARVPRVPPHALAGDVVDGLKGTVYDTASVIFVVEPSGKLVGLVPLAELLAAPISAPMRTIMRAAPEAADPRLDQEHVAALALKQGIDAVPVVDGDGMLLGAVPAQALIAILRREHIEDLQVMAGILRQSTLAVSALEEHAVDRLRRRLPWLVIGLSASTLATFVMARFEHVLQSNLAVAFFVPALVYMADAIGTQAESVAVRGLSLARRPLHQIVAREAALGALMGAALGALMMLIVYVGFGDAGLAAVVAVSLFAASLTASLLGLMLPWALGRMGFDPALGSGPVGTILQDVLTLLIYFFIARAALL
jgi:magnesium transporter